jgi:hypothetical protein
MKQIYTTDGGKYTLHMDWMGYRRLMMELTIPDDIVFNPFINLIKCSYTFEHNGNTISVNMVNKLGRGYILITSGDIEIMDINIGDFYSHYQFQMEYWNMFGIPLVFHLKEGKVLNDENIEKYCSVLFYPPVGERTEWDKTTPDEDISSKKKWSDVTYNEDGTITLTKCG